METGRTWREACLFCGEPVVFTDQAKGTYGEGILVSHLIGKVQYGAIYSQEYGAVDYFVDEILGIVEQTHRDLERDRKGQNPFVVSVKEEREWWKAKRRDR